MADRILIWHIPTLPVIVPTYYADRDYEVAALRIHAEKAPGAGDLVVDILDDGVSIMNANNYQKITFKAEDAYIEFGTPSATAFRLGETIDGTTSSASAKVIANNSGRLTLKDVSGAFTLAETITGATTGATGIVNAYVRAVNYSDITNNTGQSHAILPKNATSDSEAADFRRGADIREGSWISLSLLDAAGAYNITVQLELNALAVSTESRPWAE